MKRLPTLIARRYEVQGLLGQGASGTVYAVRDRTSGEELALKLLGSEDRWQAQWSWRLRREFFVMAQLRHPCIVEVKDFGEHQALPYFTMERVEGDELRVAGASLQLDEALAVVAQLAAALAVIHARGYAHRDIKPSNVRLRRPLQPDATTAGGAAELRVKLLDFGILAPLGTTGESAGTPGYVAPEAAFGAPVTPRMDVYSLGVLARWLLAPHAHLVSEPISHLIEDMLATDPARRPFGMEQVLERLGPAGEAALATLGDDRPTHLEPSLVGRQRELLSLRQAFGEASSSQGRGSARVILAPPGMGKTRLLEAFVLEMRIAGARLGFQLGDEPVPPVPCGAFSLALRRLQGAVANEEPALVARFGSLLEEMSESRPPGERTDPGAAHLRRANALHDLLARAGARRPVVLVIDDLQRSDDDGRELVLDLLANPPPRVLVLATVRRDPDPFSLGLERRLEPLGERLVALQPLGADDVEQLLSSLFGLHSVDRQLVVELAAAAGGNPFFALEIVRAMVDAGEIRRRGPRWQLPSELPARALPRSLEEALRGRLARLSGPAARLARILAVVGEAQPLELLARLVGVPDPELLPALDELLLRQVLRETEGPTGLPGPGIGFLHPRLREVIYDGLPPEERERLHRTVGRAFEQRSELMPLEREVRVARHLARGGTESELEGAHRLVRVGQQLFRAHAVTDAASALALGSLILDRRQGGQPPSELLAAWELIGRAGMSCEPERSIRALRRLRHVLRARPPLAHLHRYRELVGGRLALIGGLVAATATRAFDDPLHAFGDSVGVVQRYSLATAYLASLLAWTARTTEALEVAEDLGEIVRAAGQTGRVPEGAYAVSRLSALLLKGRYREALQLSHVAERCLSADRKTPIEPLDRINMTSASLVFRVSCLVHLADRRYESAITELEQHIEQHQALQWTLNATIMRVIYHCVRGEIGQMLELRRRYLEQASRVHLGWQEFVAHAWPTMALVEAGHAEEATVGLRRLEATAPGGYYRDGIGSLVRGLAHLAASQLESAEAELTRGLEHADSPAVEARVGRATARLGLCEVRLRQGRPDEALALARRVFDQADNPANPAPLEAARARRLMAEARDALDPSAPTDPFLEPLRRAEEIDLPLERALCQLGRARRARRLGRLDDQRALAGQAREALVQLGQRRQVAEADRLLGSTTVAASQADRTTLSYPGGLEAGHEANTLVDGAAAPPAAAADDVATELSRPR